MANDDGVVDAADVVVVTEAQVPLILTKQFSWRALAAVMAEKFGLRGLRITAMIGVMIGYLWWRGCDGVMCIALYIFAATTILLAIIIAWTAKEALEKFAVENPRGTLLIINANGIGARAEVKAFHLPWSDFRRVVERNQLWLLETVHGSWMVLPTTHFTKDAWTIMRAHQKQRVYKKR